MWSLFWLLFLPHHTVSIGTYHAQSVLISAHHVSKQSVSTCTYPVMTKVCPWAHMYPFWGGAELAEKK